MTLTPVIGRAMLGRAGDYEQLHRNQIHVWLTFFQDHRLDDLLDEYRRLLSAAELVQEKRFYFELDRRRYLVTRALLRCTLSRYVNLDPSAWHFSVNKYGRPHIANREGDVAHLHFNISHTNSLIAIAVSVQGALGVDAENVSRPLSVATLADRYFANTEKADLRLLPLAEQPYRFFEYWTLKESYIKARGMGLAIPLDRFSFDVSRRGQIAFSVASSLGDDAAGWSFWQWSLGTDYLLALCSRRDAKPPPQVSLWRTLPLLGSEPEDVQPSRTSNPKLTP